jgi:hypothetical protein
MSKEWPIFKTITVTQKLPVYKLPLTIYQDSGEPCRECEGHMIDELTHLAPIINTDGIYIGEYSMQGPRVCDQCGVIPDGLPKACDPNPKPQASKPGKQSKKPDTSAARSTKRSSSKTHAKRLNGGGK